MQAPERIDVFLVSEFCVRPESEPGSGLPDSDGIEIRDFDQDIFCGFCHAAFLSADHASERKYLLLISDDDVCGYELMFAAK